MTDPRHRVWAKWLIATLLGYIIGVPVAIGLTAAAAVLVSNPGETDILVGLCVGASIGFTQAFVLRTSVRSGVVWVVGAALAFGIPFTTLVAFSESLVGPTGSEAPWIVLSALVAGAIGGACQYSSLETRVGNAGRWLWMSIALGAALSAVFVASPEPPAGLIAGTVVYGLLGGGLVAWLFQTNGVST